MTILISLFGLAGRVAGDLLTSALGWASSLLFGRVPRAHHVYLVLLMAGSFLWLLMVAGLLVPGIAALLLSSTPHPPAVTQSWLGLVLAIGVIVMPLGVGLAGYLVPATGHRPRGVAVVREVLRGYVVAPLMGGLLIFLAGVGMARKARSWRHAGPTSTSRSSSSRAATTGWWTTCRRRSRASTCRRPQGTRPGCSRCRRSS